MENDLLGKVVPEDDAFHPTHRAMGNIIGKMAGHEISDKTPLLKACMKGDLYGVKTIHSDAPGRINIERSNLGWTPLMCAVASGNFELVEYLLCKLQVAAHEPELAAGFQAIAIASGTMEYDNCVRLLIEKGAQPVISPIIKKSKIETPLADFDKYRPLMQACYAGNLDLINLFLSMGESVSASAVRATIEADRLNAFLLLVESADAKKAKITLAENYEAFGKLAILLGAVRITRFLCENTKFGSKLSSTEKPMTLTEPKAITVVQFAAYYSYSGLLRFLLTEMKLSGNLIPKKGDMTTAMSFALLVKAKTCAQLLINVGGVKFDNTMLYERDWTPLQTAAFLGLAGPLAEIIKVSNGEHFIAKTSASDRCRSVLELAVDSGNVECAIMVLEAAPSLALEPSYEGYDLLSFAIYREKYDVFMALWALLPKLHVPKDRSSSKLLTLIHLCASMGLVGDVPNLMLSTYPDWIRLQTFDNMTPLVAAIRAGNENFCKYLFAKDPTIVEEEFTDRTSYLLLEGLGMDGGYEAMAWLESKRPGILKTLRTNIS